MGSWYFWHAYKFVYRGKNTTIPVGHAFPYHCAQEVYDEIGRQMQAAVSATGADQCSVNADVFVDGKKVSIIEMGGKNWRNLYSGIDFYLLRI